MRVCSECGRDMELVGLRHLCVPRGQIKAPAVAQISRVVETLPAEMLPKKRVTKRYNEDCPVCRARREVDRARLRRWRARRRGEVGHRTA